MTMFVDDIRQPCSQGHGGEGSAPDAPHNEARGLIKHYDGF